MKRYGNLWGKITDFSNLLYASRQARKGKRFRNNVLQFENQCETELLRLQTELINKTYSPGAYRTFYIHKPKKRLISAAPYHDRIVHHALCHIIMPLFERTFIRDSYANRTGFGTHRALQRFTQFSRQYQYVLQCDIQKYFANIDHEILKKIISRKIKCSHTLWLTNIIIDHSNPQYAPVIYFRGDSLLTPAERRRGLPVGNLTSQLFANVYLNGFDHFIKEELKISAYLRYVDDFALFSNDKKELEKARIEIEQYLAQLRLKIHPIKSQLFKTKIGASFLGFRILPTHIRVRNENLRRARRRIRIMQKAYTKNLISLKMVEHSMQSWLVHLQQGNTKKLVQNILQKLSF